MEKYQEKCVECNGNGYVTIHSLIHLSAKVKDCCPICAGRGKIDWIDIIKKGKKLPDGDYDKGFRKIKGKWFAPN